MRHYIFLLIFFAPSLFCMIGCKQADVYPPIIKLSGENILLLFRGEQFQDPGASGSDFEGKNKSKDISAKIIRKGELDIQNAGQYNLTYQLQDEAGNQAEEVNRTVIVRHRPEDLLGTYNVTDSCDGNYLNYLTNIDSVLPGNKLRVFNFGNQNLDAYFSIKGSFHTEVFLESQSIVNKTYAGAGNISKDGLEFIIRYSSYDGNASTSCTCIMRKI